MIKGLYEQTREERIKLHYRDLKKRCYKNGDSLSFMWMILARVWKMPIKKIVKD